MRWRYLLFDLDGTLTDPMLGITRSVQYALRRFGIEVDDLRTLCRSRSRSATSTAWTTNRPHGPWP